MKTKTKAIGTLGAVILVLAEVFAGCANFGRTAAIESATPIRTEPKRMQKWVNNPKSAETKTEMAIVGTSGRFATATGDYGAIKYAEVNGRNKLSQLYGTLIANQARTHAAIVGITAETLSPSIISQELNEWLSMSLVQGLAVKDHYIEVFIDRTNREAYDAHVLMLIDKSIVKASLDSWGKKKSEEFLEAARETQDEARREQNTKAAEFFGNDLSGKLGL